MVFGSSSRCNEEHCGSHGSYGKNQEDLSVGVLDGLEEWSAWGFVEWPLISSTLAETAAVRRVLRDSDDTILRLSLVLASGKWQKIQAVRKEKTATATTTTTNPAL